MSGLSPGGYFKLVSEETNQDLVRKYSEDQSESAFAELVRRHVDMVYSTALRMVRDPHLAEDITQSVFLELARHARRLAGHSFLSAWLHRTARNIAANAIRSNMRRQARENEAVVMQEMLSDESDHAWEEISPYLDAALDELPREDRDAILLRYFERKSAREIAATLGIGYEAAQKRLTRATERLRISLARLGATAGVSGLAAILATNAVGAAPADLASKILATASSAGGIASASTAISISKIIVMTTVQKTALAAVLIAVVGTGFYQSYSHTHGSQTMKPVPRPPPYKVQPRETVTEFRHRADTPQTRATHPASLAKVEQHSGSGGVPFTSTRMYQFLKQKEPKLILAQLDSFLTVNGRNAASLLAAYRTTSDSNLLAEALSKFGNDPQVNFEAAIRTEGSPVERLERLDALKKADPENSLPYYLSALEHFKEAKPDETVQDLVSAASKQKFQDYSADRSEANEDAYLSAGYPAAEAKLIANNFLPTPQLSQFKELAQYLVGMAGSYKEAGDADSQRNALQIAIDLGRRFSDPASGESLLNQIVGITIERSVLESMDPATTFDSSKQTIQNRLDQLNQRKETIHELARQADPLWEQMSEQDWMNYYAQKANGSEEDAIQWLISRAGR